jgi:hypothetical protein
MVCGGIPSACLDTLCKYWRQGRSLLTITFSAFSVVGAKVVALTGIMPGPSASGTPT